MGRPPALYSDSVPSPAALQYLACLNPTAGSFVINPRLQRHFLTLAIGFPGPTSLHTIYSTFLEGHLKSFSEEVQGLATNLLSAALQLHASVATTFRKSATNFHYGGCLARRPCVSQPL